MRAGPGALRASWEPGTRLSGVSAVNPVWLSDLAWVTAHSRVLGLRVWQVHSWVGSSREQALYLTLLGAPLGLP